MSDLPDESVLVEKMEAAVDPGMKCMAPGRQPVGLQDEWATKEDHYRFGWNACRAEMLRNMQAALSVLRPYLIPEGWVAAPKEPTPAMTDAGQPWALDEALSRHCYKAMLAAAPHFMELPPSPTQGRRRERD